MTLSELDDSLPNGFHDAYLLRIEVDFRNSSGLLAMRILVSGTEESNRYEDVDVRLAGIEAITIEGPEDLRRVHQGPLGICSFETTEKQFSGLATASEEMRRRFHSFFVEPWNSFIHIAAREANVVRTDR